MISIAAVLQFAVNILLAWSCIQLRADIEELKASNTTSDNAQEGTT
jgi:hypothetical protein